MNDEIFDVEQSGPLTWFLVSFSPIVSSAHELSCFDRFAYTYRLVIGFPHYTVTYSISLIPCHMNRYLVCSIYPILHH